MNHHPFAERLLTTATCLFLLVAPFTASAGWRAGCLSVAMAVLVYYSAMRVLEWPRPVPRALLAALAAWCALSSASYFWSVDPQQTLDDLRREVLYGAMAFVVFYIAASPARWRLWWPTMLAGALVLVAAETLRQALEPALGTREWDGGGGALSTHLLLLAPFLLPLAWSARADGRPQWLLFFASLALLLLALWGTENRIVWPALLVTFAVIGLARRSAARPWPPMHGARYVVAASLALAVVLAGHTLRNRVEANPAMPSSFTENLQRDLRPRLWAIGCAQIAAAPWFGHGFGREIAAGAFRPETPRGGVHPMLTHAHNVFLNIGMQLGLAGIALFSLVLLLLAREFARALERRETAPPAILGLAVLAGFVAKNLTDDFFFRHNALVFWAVMGMLLGLTRTRANA